MLYSRYLELCKEKKKAPSSVAKELGYSKNAFTRWKDSAEQSGGVVSLRSEMLIKIADYFCVTLDYLCGRTDIRTEKLSVLDELSNSPRKMLLLDETDGMTDKSMEQLIRLARAIKGMQD
jgi:hypothetical protein